MKAIYKLAIIICAGGTILSIVSCSKKKSPNPAPASATPALVYDANNHAALYPTTGMVTDALGNLYIAKGNTIAVITQAGVQTVIAGSAQNENGYADGKGSAAMFDMPSGLAIDAAHNIYVADAANNMIRKITADGTVTTIAGSGAIGSADGKGTAASFRFPQGITVDNSGNIYVTDTGNDLIRRITPDGTVSTVAGKVEPGKTDGVGSAARFNIPEGITIDDSGNLVIADAGNNLIRKMTQDGIVSTFAGSGYATSFNGTGKAAAFDFPNAVTTDSNGYLYVTEGLSNKVSKIAPDAQVIRLGHVNSVTNLPNGNEVIIYDPDIYYFIVSPNGITFNSAKSDLFISDYGHGLLREGPTSTN